MLYFSFRSEHSFPGLTSLIIGGGGGVELHTRIGSLGVRALVFHSPGLDMDTNGDGHIDTTVGSGYALFGVYDAIPVRGSVDLLVGWSWANGSYPDDALEYRNVKENNIEAGVRVRL